MTTPSLTNFVLEPAAGQPGWQRWRILDEALFNEAVLGPQYVRRENDRTVRVRLVPRVPLHANAGGKVHGAVTLALADISLFATLYLVSGIDAGTAVTLDLSTQFIGAGDVARPLDAVVELLRETRRLAFLRGTVVQDDDIVAAFGGTVRKGSVPA